MINRIYISPPLGLVAKHKRAIRPGVEYNKYFPSAKNQYIFLGNKNTFQAVESIQQIVKSTLDQTAEITKVLFDENLDKFCSNIWHFLYNHIQYKLDQKGREELRSPKRSWTERATGIDCDCFSIFASSILTNAKIPHKLRIVELGNKGYYQHIYVIVPKAANIDCNPWTASHNYYTIDPVLDKYNTEPNNITFYKDFPMGSPTYFLNGVDDDQHLDLGCACQNNNLGKAKTNLRVAYQNGKKTVVATSATAVNRKVNKASQIPSARIKPVIKKPAVRLKNSLPVKRVVTNPNTGKQAVVINKASTNQSASARIKPFVKKPAVPVKTSLPVKRIVTNPNTGKPVVAITVSKAVANSVKNPNTDKIMLRDQIIGILKLRPTLSQKETFITRFGISDMVRAKDLASIVQRAGVNAIRPEERELINRIIFQLTPPKNNVVATSSVKSSAAASSILPVTTQNTPVRTIEPVVNNSVVEQPEQPENIINDNTDNQNPIDNNPVVDAPKAKKGNWLGIIAAVMGAAYLLMNSLEKEKTLSGTEEVEVEAEVIETNPLGGPDKSKSKSKPKPKTIKTLKI